MVDQADDDIEFIPSDELSEAEPDDAEQRAMHIQEREEPTGRMVVEAQELQAAAAEELEIQAAEDEAGEDEAFEEEHEEDLEETLRRHYGIVSEEPEEEPAGEEPGVRTPGVGEFVCRSCFLRKPASQLSDPARGLCADCATNGASAA